MFFFQALEQFENKCFFILNFKFFFFCFNLLDLNFFFFSFFLILFVYSLQNNFSLFLNKTNWFIFYIINFVKNIVFSQTLGYGFCFMPLCIVIFFFVLIFNLMGLLPYCFCATSHLFVVFTISFALFVGLTSLGFILNGFQFFLLFVPKNVPSFLLPFLICIEAVSYLSRVFSLAIRLFANMVAGHALMHILLNFD